MYHIIINPKSSSGKGIKHWWSVKNVLDGQNIPYTAYFTDYAGHGTAIAKEIYELPSTVKNIIVLGGDGTLNEVLNGLDDFHNISFGYIPSGSSNDLARSLGIPKDPIEALQRILHPSRFQELDMGEIRFRDGAHSTRRFICSSGIGWDANVCVEVQKSSLKKRLNQFGMGKLIYLAIALKQIVKIKLSSVSIQIDNKNTKTYDNVLLISHMIHKFEGGGLPMAPTADPTDGKLNICLVHGLSRLKIFVLLPTIIFGKHIYFKGVEYFSCKSINIDFNHASAVHTDGETPAFSSQITVTCIPKKVRIIL